ncbi:MAG: elongation factor 1-beta, partial [Desulfurococcaceae archaeon]
IAYGYKALLLHIRFPENTEGGTEELESKILSVAGVSSVEIEAVSRTL